MWQTSANGLEGSTRYFDTFCGSHKIIFVKPKRLLKTQVFGKKATFPLKKLFPRLLFLVSSNVTNLKQWFKRLHKLFWHLLSKLLDHSFRAWKVVEKTIFWKGNISCEKNLLAYFCSLYWTWPTLGITLWGHTKFSDKYCANYAIIFLGAKKLRKKIFKKILSSWWQKVLAYFCSLYRT